MMSEASGKYLKESFRRKSAAVSGRRPPWGRRPEKNFWRAFRRKTAGCRIGFCVMGGIFAEGIDLTGKRLIGALVIGTGLPGISGERELLRRFYDRRGKSGFDYAYRFPGMNKVLQAAGRVIRTTEDVGVILLLDDRFQLQEYRKPFSQGMGGLPPLPPGDGGGELADSGAGLTGKRRRTEAQEEKLNKGSGRLGHREMGVVGDDQFTGGQLLLRSAPGTDCRARSGSSPAQRRCPGRYWPDR